MNGEYTIKEIEEQPKVWEEILRNPPIIGEIRDKEEIIYFGSGTSYYLALSLAGFTQRYTKIHSRALPSQELVFFPKTTITNKPTLYVGISRSGETTEVVMAMDKVRELGMGDFLAITTNKDSSLTAKSKRTIVLESAEEKSVVMTKSFTSMLLCLQLGILNTLGVEDLSSFREKLINVSKDLFPKFKELSRSLAQKEQKEIIFLGSGPLFGIACESALKVREMSSSLTSAFHTLEFRHGPRASLTRESLVVLLLSDSAKEEEIKVAEEIRDIGAECVVIGESLSNGVDIKSDLNEFLRLVLYMPFAQYLGYFKAIKKGLDPDMPLNLTQVVKI